MHRVYGTRTYIYIHTVVLRPTVINFIVTARWYKQNGLGFQSCWIHLTVRSKNLYHPKFNQPKFLLVFSLLWSRRSLYWSYRAGRPVLGLCADLLITRRNACQSVIMRRRNVTHPHMKKTGRLLRIARFGYYKTIKIWSSCKPRSEDDNNACLKGWAGTLKKQWKPIILKLTVLIE